MTHNVISPPPIDALRNDYSPFSDRAYSAGWAPAASFGIDVVFANLPNLPTAPTGLHDWASCDNGRGPLSSAVFAPEGFLRRSIDSLFMADRTPIFGTKATKPQIGYIENGGAFGLSGRRRFNYNAETGNLSDCITGKLVGYVSKENNFVVPSRIASELFEQPVDSEAPTPSLTAEGEHAEEYANKGNPPQTLGEPTDAFLERAMAMVRSSFKKEPP